jgi:hypothetical protein
MKTRLYCGQENRTNRFVGPECTAGTQAPTLPVPRLNRPNRVNHFLWVATRSLGVHGKHHLTKCIQLTLLLHALGACGQSSNLLKNGSFEQGSFVADENNSMSLRPDSKPLAGWAITNVVQWIGTPNPWNFEAVDGKFLLDLTGYVDAPPYGGVSQTISTHPGAKYMLSFYIGTMESAPDPMLSGPVSIIASADSTSVEFSPTPNGEGNKWQRVHMEFTATSTNTVIIIQGTKAKNYIGLDQVSATLLPVLPNTQSHHN